MTRSNLFETMENSAYVSPPPLPPAAHLSSSAVAAFQAACNTSGAGLNFQEALLSRMGRGHFGLTVRRRRGRVEDAHPTDRPTDFSFFLLLGGRPKRPLCWTGPGSGRGGRRREIGVGPRRISGGSPAAVAPPASVRPSPVRPASAFHHGGRRLSAHFREPRRLGRQRLRRPKVRDPDGLCVLHTSFCAPPLTFLPPSGYLFFSFSTLSFL